MRKQLHSNVGAILIVTALFIVAGIALVALVVDIGMFYLARRELDAITELAARAAVVRFHEVQNATHQQRADAAIARAIEIAQANRIRGLQGVPLGAIGTEQSPGESGSVEFGQFFSELPPCQGGTCPALTCGNLPCFEPVPSTGGTVNAARVRLWTAQSRPIATLFAKILGISSLQMSSERIVALAPRCGVFLVDLSNSMTIANYKPLSILDPNTPGMGGPFAYYAFTEEAVQKGEALFNAVGGAPNAASMSFTQVNNVYSTSSNPLVSGQTKASLAWFSLLAHKQFRPPSGASPADEHYADDYILTNVTFGNQVRHYYIDGFRDALHQGPEPFRSILEVIHNLVKYLRQSALATDYIQIAGFDYDIRGSALVSRSQFALLQQITNLGNGPLTTSPLEIHPNFTDYGLLPREDAPTNIFEPLYVAIENLSDPAMCPANAEKHIFVISDFIFNVIPGGVPDLPWFQMPPRSFAGQYQLESNSNMAYFSDTYAGYQTIRGIGIPGVWANPAPTHPWGTRSMARWPLAGPLPLPEVVQQAGNGIHVHSVIVGDHVGPHLLNLENPNWTGSYATSDHYRFPDFLTGLGIWPTFYLLGNDFGVNYPRIFNGTYGSPSDGPNYHPFLEPNWTAYWMASNLNGLFCPLRPPPPPSECVTDPFDSTRLLHDEINHRSHNTPQYFSPDCTSKSEQFTKCVQDTFVRGVPVYPVAEYNN